MVLLPLGSVTNYMHRPKRYDRVDSAGAGKFEVFALPVSYRFTRTAATAQRCSVGRTSCTCTSNSIWGIVTNQQGIVCNHAPGIASQSAGQIVSFELAKIATRMQILPGLALADVAAAFSIAIQASTRHNRAIPSVTSTVNWQKTNPPDARGVSRLCSRHQRPSDFMEMFSLPPCTNTPLIHFVFMCG